MSKQVNSIIGKLMRKAGGVTGKTEDSTGLYLEYALCVSSSFSMFVTGRIAISIAGSIKYLICAALYFQQN